MAKAPVPIAPVGLKPIAELENWNNETHKLALSLFGENAPLGDYPVREGYEPIIQKLVEKTLAGKKYGTLEAYSAGLWKAAISSDDIRRFSGANALASFTEKALNSESASLAATFSRTASRGPMHRRVFSKRDYNIPQVAEKIRGISGKATLAIGAVEIPVDESDPSYPIYKSNAEYVMGNLDTAWDLYQKNTDALTSEVLRKLAVEYAFWILKRNIAAEEQKRSENLIKELTIWSRQVAGNFSPEQDALGSGYHLIQSKIALGSGGLFGKGYMNGTQSKLDFLPENHTDFIFSAFGEEFGFIGVLFLIILYVLAVIRGMSISIKATDNFARILSGTLILTIFLYVLVNIGMVIGLLPIVGAPLPFMSYGGTSMLTVFAALGIIMSVKSHQRLMRK